MRVGLMQPYFFPYISYFQLIGAVEKFIFYDDVNFIKQGWINRNRILLNNTDYLFSVPLKNVSSFKTINQTYIDINKYAIWTSKILRTLEQAYKNAKYFNECFGLVKNVLDNDHNIISELSISSVREVCKYLGLDCDIAISSLTYGNQDLAGQARVIDICKIEKANEYINASGGRELYSEADFKESGIELKFISSGRIEYQQLGNEFVPGLSIIDVLMFNAPGKVRNFIENYELI